MEFGTIADIISILGVIVSVITAIQAFRINDKLQKQKFEIRFRSQGHILKSNFSTFLDQFTNNEINLIVLTDVKRQTHQLLDFSIKCKWEKEKTNTIKQLLGVINEYIESLTAGKDCDSVYTHSLLKLTEVYSIISEEVDIL